MHLLRLLRALITAAAGTVVTLVQLNLPSKDFWPRFEAVQWLSVAVVAIFLLYDAGWSVNQAVQAPRIREYESQVREAISGTVASIVHVLGAPWDKISVQYYRCRRVGWTRRIVHIAGLRAGAVFADSDYSFRPGVGIVGTAFVEEVPVAEQWQEFLQAATKLGPQEWEQRPERQRYGLSWGQLRRSGGPDGVLASPTFAIGGKPNGCIVVSGPVTAADLGTDEMLRIIDNLAFTLNRAGPPPAGWWSDTASSTPPSLSTITPDRAEIARLALSFLERRITSGTAAGPPQAYAPFELLIRPSTAGA